MKKCSIKYVVKNEPSRDYTEKNHVTLIFFTPFPAVYIIGQKRTSERAQ